MCASCWSVTCRLTTATTAWQDAAQCLAEAARGGDPIDVSIALQMAFVMEGGQCRPM
jgi:hypothetical protein